VFGGPVVDAAAGLPRDRVANPCSTSALVELCGRLLGPAAKQQMFNLQIWRNKLQPVYNKLYTAFHINPSTVIAKLCSLLKSKVCMINRSIPLITTTQVYTYKILFSRS
jgi:hypothetical protein